MRADAALGVPVPALVARATGDRGVNGVRHAASTSPANSATADREARQPGLDQPEIGAADTRRRPDFDRHPRARRFVDVAHHTNAVLGVAHGSHGRPRRSV